MVVVLFFVPGIHIYVLPSGNENKDREISMISAVISPVLNPLNYTLRNEEMKIVMKKVWCITAHSYLKNTFIMLLKANRLTENLKNIHTHAIINPY